MNYRKAYATILFAAPGSPKRTAVLERLSRRGYSCLAADSLSEVKTLSEKESFDLLLIDSEMTNGQAAEFFMEVGILNGVPIIVLSASSCPESEIRFLDAGAADFISLGTDDSTLVARIRAHIRRDRLARGDASPALASLGRVEMDESLQTALYEDRSLNLTPTEYKVLRVLGDSLNEAVSRMDLLREVWNTEFLEDNRLIDSHVRNLRNKLAREKCGLVISSVRGVGYKLSVDGDSGPRACHPQPRILVDERP